MTTQLDPLATLGAVHFFHLLVTVSLFLLNVFITHLIGRQRWIARATYLGPEMVYLAAAIVLSHMFTAPQGTRLLVLAAVFPYLALWAGTLLLTKRVIEVGHERLHPLTVVNLLCGGVAVFFSMTGAVEGLLPTSIL